MIDMYEDNSQLYLIHNSKSDLKLISNLPKIRCHNSDSTSCMAKD